MTLTIDECKRIISEGRKQLTAADDIIAELESKNDELLEAWSNQDKTIYEQIMRIRELEQLVRDMHSVMWACRERVCVHRENNCWRVQAGGEGDGECWFEKRMKELGIDTEGGA